MGASYESTQKLNLTHFALPLSQKLLQHVMEHGNISVPIKNNQEWFDTNKQIWKISWTMNQVYAAWTKHEQF